MPLQAFIAAFKEVAAYLWQAVSKKEALSASEDARHGHRSCSCSSVHCT